MNFVCEVLIGKLKFTSTSLSPHVRLQSHVIGNRESQILIEALMSWQEIRSRCPKGAICQQNRRYYDIPFPVQGISCKRRFPSSGRSIPVKLLEKILHWNSCARVHPTHSQIKACCSRRERWYYNNRWKRGEKNRKKKGKKKKGERKVKYWFPSFLRFVSILGVLSIRRPQRPPILTVDPNQSW